VEAFEIEPSYDREDPFGQGPRVLWGRVAILAAVVVFAFLIGRLTAGGGTPANVTALQNEVNSQKSQISSLQAQLAASGSSTNPGPATIPTPTASIPGVTQVSPSAPAASTSVGPNGTTYVVVAGDSLSSIEAKFYHTIGAQYTQLLERANNLTSSVIHTGQTLTIPPASDATAVTPSAAAPTTAVSPSVTLHPSPTSTKK
jgi:LysM repeat protein